MVEAVRKPWRAALLLGRVSNLPTVWSNCLAGWLMGEGEDYSRFALLLLGASALYIGGMFLNDACDANFDRQHRKERPIPSGMISERAVWLAGFALLFAGVISLSFLGKGTPLLAIALAASILLYDFVHKLVAFSPVLMGLCRFLLYLVAASIGAWGVNGLAVWSGFALACYIIGLSYVARREATLGAWSWWPLLLLAMPIVLALIVNVGSYREPALLIAAVLGLWVMRSLRSLISPQPNIGHAVSGMLAGIVLVDWLAVADQPKAIGAVFIALFLLALGFQRFVPAT